MSLYRIKEGKVVDFFSKKRIEGIEELVVLSCFEKEKRRKEEEKKKGGKNIRALL